MIFSVFVTISCTLRVCICFEFGKLFITVFNDLMFQHSPRAHEHPGFILRLVLDGSAIRYEPDFSDFESVFLDVYDSIIKSVVIMPRVETKLYSDWVNSSICLYIAIFCSDLVN